MAGKKEQKNQTGVNKEFEQVLSALNPGENLEIEKPKKGRGGLLAGVIATVILSAAVLAWFFVFSRTENLASRLPAETSWYVSLSLPHEPRWYDRVFFWRRVETPGQNLSRLYPLMDVISWNNVGFSQNLLPLFKDKLELARLENNTLILRVSLEDIPGWLALVRDQGKESDYQGEFSAEEMGIGGWWRYLTKNPSKISWSIKKGVLYLADSQDWQNYLAPKRSLPKFERGVVQVFIKDKTALQGLDASFGQFLASGSVFPLKIIAQNNQDNLIWYASLAQKDLSGDKSAVSGLGSGDILVLSAAQAGQSYQEWRALLALLEQNQLTKNINEIETIAKEFYGLDLALVLEKIGKRALVLRLAGNDANNQPMFGPDWSLQIKDQDTQLDAELLGYLQKFGASLFAITHPQTVEYQLSDGSEMIELRAGGEGLAWQPLEWSSLGQQYSFYSLRGQGEDNGYFIGFIPGAGYFLASTLSSISQFIEPQDTPLDQDICSLPFQPALGAVIHPSVVSSDPLFNDIVSAVSISSSDDGILGGCLKF